MIVAEQINNQLPDSDIDETGNHEKASSVLLPQVSHRDRNTPSLAYDDTHTGAEYGQQVPTMADIGEVPIEYNRQSFGQVQVVPDDQIVISDEAVDEGVAEQLEKRHRSEMETMLAQEHIKELRRQTLLNNAASPSMKEQLKKQFMMERQRAKAAIQEKMYLIDSFRESRSIS